MAKTLAEKKEQLKAKEIKAKEQFRVEIVVDKNGNISVNGPIGNFHLFMKIMTGAINVASDYSLQLIDAQTKKEGGRIIVPN